MGSALRAMTSYLAELTFVPLLEFFLVKVGILL